MNTNILQTPGFGDAATWGRCAGHPNDPRTDDDGFEADEIADRAQRLLRSEDRLADILSDLWCLREAEMKAAMVKLMRGDAEPLRKMLAERAEVVARREIEDEAAEARREFEQ
ncbi:MAG: hypothetical protein FWD62_05450 [Betaproteobacteria bacterium]|nr:hypothetical protein [Betaproteobacteria bacterium]